MNDYEKMSITVNIFYKIRDSEMYGGIGSIGYASASITGNGKMMQNDFEAFISKQKKSFASGLGVSEECVQVITQEEYEMDTKDDENGLSYYDKLN